MKTKRICLGIIFTLLCLMVLVGCQSQPAPAPSPSAEPAKTLSAEPQIDLSGEIPVYRAENVDQFLASIGPERIIELENGTYELSAAADYGTGSTDSYYWRECYDGYELVINSVKDMHIEGSFDGEQPQIVTRPRYANVISFEHCEGLSISNLILGHTVEEGVCTGGVLNFEDCKAMTVGGSRLYGCGITGISAQRCRELFAIECFIYDCSQNAVYASACHDVRILNSRIYGSGADWAPGLFQAEGCNGFAVVNCEIYENRAQSLLCSSYSQQAALLGCFVRDNSFYQALFSSGGYSPSVDSCRFENNSAPCAFADMPPVDSRGNELSEDDIYTMERQDFRYTGPIVAQPVELEEHLNAEGIREVSVSTVDEFLAAIASNTLIKLEGEVFDLSQAEDYGAYGNDNYYWQQCYDGPGLVISNVRNLSIVSECDAELVALPRYADVLHFLNCENISLSGFTAGHSEGPGSCTGGVLGFENCWNTAIDDCRLYGCGIIGIYCYYCSGLEVTNTEIYDCTIGAVGLYTVMDASFENMDIHDCASPELSVIDCMDVYFEDTELKNGDYTLSGGMPTEYRYS